MPKVRRITTIIIGEGPTEYFYLNSLKDEFRELQHIKPDSPKNTSLRELERAIEDAVTMGYDRIFCLIDMDNKRKDAKSLSDYQRLKNKYHGKKVSKSSKGISYEITFIETDRCTELFFLYYFRYTGQPYAESKDIESELARICGYEKSKQFFTTHPLHQYFQKQGGSLADAISNSNKSIESVRRGERDYTYSEIGKMFKELGLLP